MNLKVKVLFGYRYQSKSLTPEQLKFTQVKMKAMAVFSMLYLSMLTVKGAIFWVKDRHFKSKYFKIESRN
jgi:hypothetical protein